MRLPWRRPTPALLQAEVQECGLVCLAMVAAHHCNSMDLGRVRTQSADAGRGLNARQLLLVAETLGLAGRALRVELHDLKHLRLPAVLHWNLDHFVVLVRVTGGRVVIHDPACGRRRLSLAAVSPHFTGVALELWPSADRLPARRERFHLRQLPGLRRAHVLRLGTLVGLSFALQLLVVVAPLHMQWVIDEGIAAGALDVVALLCVGFGLLLILRVLVHVVRSWWIVCYANQLGWDLDRGIMRHLLALPLVWFQRRHVADVLSRVGSLQPVQRFLAEGVAGLTVDLAVVILALALMLTYAPLVAGVALLASLSYAVVNAAAYPSLRQRTLEQIAAQASEQAVLLESLRTMATVRTWGLEGERLQAWQQRRSATLNTVARSASLGLGLGSAGQLLFGAENLLVIYLLAGRVLDATLTLGMLYAFLSFKGLFSTRSAAMVERVMEVAAVRLHLERLADICLAEPAGVAEPLPPPGGLPAGDLRLDGASFRFGRFDPWLLRDQNLRICEGACVAIMGPSGAGKSTLLRVLSGQLPLAAGQLTVGGQRLGPTCAGWFTAAAGTVLQDDALFTGSVSDNLTLFDPCPDAARLHTALQLAQAEPVVASLPAGLSTPLGEGASGLSGGQRQRLLLARAFYRQPRYLFLDEGTAHLDAPAAAAVQQAIAALPATRVVVTHDLQFARQADRVLWLEGGELRDITAATTSMKAAAS